MDSPLPHILESADCDGPGKPKDRLVSLLDQIEVHVEQLRKDASRLEEEKDTLLTTLDTLKNNEILTGLEDTDRDDVLRYAERLSVRCLTVDVLVKIQRDHIQQEALHQVNSLIDNLIIGLRDDPAVTRQRCASFVNACTSHGYGQSDKIFETAILGCTMDDQKRIKKRLQGLLDYIDKMRNNSITLFHRSYEENKS
ncbi:PREDICTED: BAG family molecular chaperone regulator 2 isoform X1 [Dufourea novaeangliae]|uniref:BAG family molecular chaperone regulator 2 isoform X1 n=1 Tax=Dufourea novaeangliae TaxID=178035 RepID=UPI0007676940|nr:PREDICTED: BAG family molecular chaperone regulator 2 isoform X1 [Dufourea novaeangliae]